MSQETVEVVRRIYDQLALGNFWAIAPLLDPQISWDWGSDMALVEGSTVYHGPQGVEAATREWLKAWDGARIEAEEPPASHAVVVHSRAVTTRSAFRAIVRSLSGSVLMTARNAFFSFPSSPSTGK